MSAVDYTHLNLLILASLLSLQIGFEVNARWGAIAFIISSYLYGLANFIIKGVHP